MTALVLPNVSQKILVVSPIQDKYEIYNKVNDLSSDYEYIVFNGGLTYPKGQQYIDTLLQNPKFIYCVSRSDWVAALNNEQIFNWIRQKPNAIIVDFQSRQVVIVDGGIPPNVNDKRKLLDNLELSFVSHINGKPWHAQYVGKFGYVISNNPLSPTAPIYHNYSLQLGNSNGSIYGQEVDAIGLKQLLYLY